MKFIFPPKRILVPIDMSDASLAALALAKGMSKRYGARLDLVYVQDLPLSLLGAGPEIQTGTMGELAAQMEDFRRWREERIRALIRDVPPNRVRVRTVRGAPAPSLADVANAGRADIIVMGTHGYTGIDRVVFGSIAESVVRRAKAPVLTVHERQAASKFSRILVPYNFQAYAKDALLAAAKAAGRAKARMTVLYVRGPETRGPSALRHLQESVRTVLGKVAAARLKLTVRKGDPRREIIREALGGRCDLIVLAAHRKTFLKERVLGSTAERILRHSPVPVLSIPSWEKPGRGLGALVSGKLFG